MESVIQTFSATLLRYNKILDLLDQDFTNNKYNCFSEHLKIEQSLATHLKSCLKIIQNRQLALENDTALLSFFTAVLEKSNSLQAAIKSKMANYEIMLKGIRNTPQRKPLFSSSSAPLFIDIQS